MVDTFFGHAVAWVFSTNNQLDGCPKSNKESTNECAMLFFGGDDCAVRSPKTPVPIEHLLSNSTVMRNTTATYASAATATKTKTANSRNTSVTSAIIQNYHS
jgi:hypothetical protein